MADRSALEAQQRANGCNEDDDPTEWGVPCCECCIRAEEVKGEPEDG